MIDLSRSDLIYMDVDLIRETDIAVLVKSSETDEQAWVPKSLCQIEPVSGYSGDVLHLLTIPEDIAIEKGLV